MFARKGYISLNLADFEFQHQKGKHNYFGIQARQECISKINGDVKYFFFLFDLSGENLGIPVHILKNDRSEIDEIFKSLIVY